MLEAAKLIPPRLRERLDDRRRALVLIWISFALAGSIGAAWLLRALVAEVPLASHVLLGTTVLLFSVTPFVLRYRGELRGAASLLVTTLLAATLVVGMQNGGTEAPVLVILFFSPVVATFLLGRGAGLVTLGAAVSIVVGLHLLHVTDLAPASALSGEAMRLARISATVLGVVAITAVVICYELARVDSESQIRREQVRAQEAEKAQGEFLARMSHELRTPLNAVIGGAELLSGRALGRGDRELISIIGKAGTSLVEIVDDILDFSRIESGGLTVEPHPFDPRECLESCVSTYAALASSRDIDLALFLSDDIPRRVVGDSGRLRQVLTNLISNALKFTHEGSVYIEASAAALGAGQARLSVEVQDTGIGIPSDLEEVVFEAFSQADGSISRRYGGSGLGLAISRRLCEMMGGTISFEPRPEGGTSFSFSVVVAIGIHEYPGVVDEFELAEIPVVDGGLRILIVEPGEATQRAVVATLDGWGMTTHSFGSWSEAEASRANLATVDLVLAGSLPDSAAGLTLVAELVENQVPWACIGATGDPGGLDVAPQQLLKPIRRRDLAQVLNLRQADPALAIEAPSGDPEQTFPNRFAGTRVLVAEDNPVNQLVAVAMLESLGCEVQIAPNGDEALELLDNNRYDLVFLDLHMPRLDGLETARRIRDRQQPVPILIALTASVLEEDRDQCLAAGMNGFLAKPIRISDLVEVLDQHLEPAGADVSEVQSEPAA